MCRIALIIIVLVQVKISEAQPAYLVGKYVEDCPFWSYEQNTFEFFPNLTFAYYKTSDFGEFYGTGKYTLTKDSIELDFEPINKANNRFEVLTGKVDSNALSENMSTIRVYHALFHNKTILFSYQHYRNDSLLASKSSSLYGLIKLKVQQGDSLYIMATDWKEYFLGIPFTVSEEKATSYVFLVNQLNIGLMGKQHSEKMKIKLRKNKEQLQLIRAVEPNFLHPGTNKNTNYKFMY